MSKQTLEHLSSLMDGELSRETSLFLARRLSSDESLSETWKRYHMIRDCLRQPGSAGTPVVDLGARMRSALEAEQVEPQARSWMRPLAGAAIAASVALMAIVAVGPQTNPGAVEAATAQPFSSPNTISGVPRTEAASFSGAAPSRDAQLNRYLIRHNQLAGSASKGFVSFVPIIATEPAADDKDESANEQLTAENRSDSNRP